MRIPTTISVKLNCMGVGNGIYQTALASVVRRFVAAALVFCSAASLGSARELASMSSEEVAALEKPYRPHKILGHAQPAAKAMHA